MDIKLNAVLNLTDEEIENSKIEFNMQVGSGGRPFLDVWLKHTEEEKSTGTCNDCSFWIWYGKQRNFYPGQTVFSFARITDDEWLFISAAKIVDTPHESFATVEVIEKFAPLFGRLIIRCKKGNTYARYTFNLSKFLEQTTIKEILPCLYSGEAFEGYARVHLPFFPRKIHCQRKIGQKLFSRYFPPHTKKNYTLFLTLPNYLKFYSYDDLLIQMKRYLKRSNNIPMAILGWESPLQRRDKLEQQAL